VVRWALRLFRHEWRQQLLVLGLVVFATAATFVGAAVAINAPRPLNAEFGTAQDLALFEGSNPQLSSQIAVLSQRFGRVDVIENQTLVIPGSIDVYDERGQDPHGPFGSPMLKLVSGRYPTGPSEVALTRGVASELGLSIGGVWRGAGQARQVVGMVENPQNLLDAFALVAPDQVSAPTRVTVLFDAPHVRLASIGPNVLARGSPRPNNVFNPETIAIAAVTLGMLLIALVSVGGFTVLAQRRLRSLGMLASVGATDRHVGLVVRANGVVVGLVGSVLGAILGFLLWLAYLPHLESSAHHLVGVFALPWRVIALAVVLAAVATYLAARRPARSIARVPIVAALSGRPAPPRPVHRSAIPGLVFFAIAFVLLGYSGGSNHGGGGGAMGALVLGLVALIPAVILLSPFCLALVARLASRAPLSVRMALRDLARYRARAGSALAAISIGVLIAVIITIVAAARYGNALDYAGPNLASNQIVVYPPGNTPNGREVINAEPSAPGAILSQPSVGTMAATVQDIADSLGSGGPVELDTTEATLHHEGSGRDWCCGPLYVASPQLLRAFGVDPSRVDPNADVLTMRPGISSLSKMDLVVGKVGPGAFTCSPSTCVAHPKIQEVRGLPSGTSAPNSVITEHAVQRLHLTPQAAAWLIQSPAAITASQIRSARLAAAAASMTIESKNDQLSSSTVINGATVFGIVLALAILAMSVGLIRSETASDLRTLAATGASSIARRTLTGATAGALALLGALLGTIAGYVAVIGWLRSNSLNGGISALGNVPVAQLLLILLGMPLIALAGGWLLGGREPSAIARQPLE
jgi:putative ABC transport system permease protein